MSVMSPIGNKFDKIKKFQGCYLTDNIFVLLLRFHNNNMIVKNVISSKYYLTFIFFSVLYVAFNYLKIMILLLEKYNTHWRKYFDSTLST